MERLTERQQSLIHTAAGTKPYLGDGCEQPEMASGVIVAPWNCTVSPFDNGAGS